MSKEKRFEYTKDKHSIFMAWISDAKTDADYITTSQEDMKNLTILLNEQDRQLEIYKKALTLAREYMFNVMCADDVPSENWFIKCAKNNQKPS